MIMVVYADTTDLFTEEEIIETGNLVELDIPESIVRDWYEQDRAEHEEQTAADLGIPLEECSFEQWRDNVYTADETQDLYDYAVMRGWTTSRDDYFPNAWGWCWKLRSLNDFEQRF